LYSFPCVSGFIEHSVKDIQAFSIICV
jgi:hypothetical protein